MIFITSLSTPYCPQSGGASILAGIADAIDGTEAIHVTNADAEETVAPDMNPDVDLVETDEGNNNAGEKAPAVHAGTAADAVVGPTDESVENSVQGQGESGCDCRINHQTRASTGWLLLCMMGLFLRQGRRQHRL